MLTKVEVRTPQGTLLSLELQDVSDGLIVESIEGLDPVKATIVSSSVARLDGTQYQASRREDRNIKLQIGLEPDYAVETVRDLRKRLYKFLMPKREVNLRFYDSDGLTAEIMGRVESFETALFTKEPAVDVSIICFDPDFIDLNPVVLSGNTVADTGSVTPPILVQNAGTVESGIVFTLNVNRTLTEFTIYNRTADDTLQSLDFEAALQAGDVLTISTIPGAKGATLTRAGVDSSILYGVSPQSSWIEMQEGDNNLRIYATGAPVPWTLEYTPRYGGL